MLSPVRRLGGSVLVLVAVACSGPTAPSTLASSENVASPNAAATTGAIASDPVVVVLELTNAERRRAGLPELKPSRQLTQAAQLQSEQMKSASMIDHVIPGAPYPSPADRLAAVNYDWDAFGENVAMGQRSGDEVVSAWMNSAGHRANILNARYTELGVGFARDATGRPYYAQVFAHPR